ncbi:MAG: LPS translocon maturation chaperone LptM [Marinicella sp.]
MKNNESNKWTVNPLVIKSSVLVVKASILMMMLLLIGCGNKGDLYMPEQEQEQKQEQKQSG